MGRARAERAVSAPVPTVAAVMTVAVLAFLGRAVALEKCVALRITNCHARTVSIAYGPVDLCAEVRVQPDERHRYLETVWDYTPPDVLMFGAGDVLTHEPERCQESELQNGAVGSSVRSLDGADQPIRNDVTMHHLEGGTYRVTSTTYTDEDRKKVCGRASARVVVH